MMSEMIRVEHLYKRFGNTETGIKEVLSDVSFSVENEGFLGIMGPSGCGKTTLLKMLGLLERISDGEIYFGDTPVSSMSEDKKCRYRREKIGFVFQDYLLMDSLNVEDNIILPLLIDHKKDADLYKKAHEIGEILGISGIMKRYPAKLSGGEKQRTAICRALINQPDLILADEPTGNLDENNREIVIQELLKVNRDLHKTIVLVTHDSYAASFCSRVLHLDAH